MKTTLLIDGDLIAFGVSAVKEMTLDRARKIVDNKIDKLMDALKADDYEVFLGDVTNFRKEIAPSYKHKRKKHPKPALLPHLEHHLRVNHGAISLPSLEADDVMGLWATDGCIAPGDRYVMVSKDKDMKQVPGFLYNPDHPELGIIETDLKAADRCFYLQVITGDACDGYPGIPGVGPTGAVELLDSIPEGMDPWTTIQLEYQFYLGDPAFSDAFALRQARLARILRAGEYDFKNQKPILWIPASSL